MASRLRRVRLAERGDNAGAWAAKVGLTASQLSNYENGIPLSKSAAIRLATKVPGLTTDYLLMGRMEGLSFELRQRIEAVEESDATQKTRA